MKKKWITLNGFLFGVKIDRQWEKKAKRIGKQATFQDHVIAVSLSFIAGVILFLLVSIFFLPKTLPIPETTAINWLVLNKHSMTLDYIRFGLFVLIILVSIVAGWIMLIWQKNR